MPGPQTAYLHQCEVPRVSIPAGTPTFTVHNRTGLLRPTHACSRLDQASIPTLTALHVTPGRASASWQPLHFPETQVQCKVLAMPLIAPAGTQSSTREPLPQSPSRPGHAQFCALGAGFPALAESSQVSAGNRHRGPRACKVARIQSQSGEPLDSGAARQCGCTFARRRRHFGPPARQPPIGPVLSPAV